MFLPSSDHVLSCTAGKTQQSGSPGELRGFMSQETASEMERRNWILEEGLDEVWWWI